jgi:cytochrome c-type biogenesis protein
LEITLGLAFLAGLASFLSPCVFSLVPAYVGYLGGRAAASGGDQQSNKLRTFLHGLAFVAGFSVIFIALGVMVSALGGILYDIRNYLAKIGGVIVILFGLHMSGIFRIPYLDYELRPQTRIDENRSYISSFLLGIFFSAGWSPCVGPVLGAVLTIAINQGSLSKGFFLLTSYSLGMAIPFLMAALGIGWVTYLLRNHKKTIHIIEKAMGFVLIFVGVLLFLGVFEQLARFGVFIDFGL